MFAPNETASGGGGGGGGGGGSTPAAQKRRTITLTHRAPISIVEDDWPIAAQGTCGEEHVTGPDEGWSISIRVRWEKKGQRRCVIHARYHSNMGDDERHWQTARVGHLLDAHHAARDLWKEIFAVGEELRARIGHEGIRKYVTYAVDNCFADLKPHEL